MRGAPSGRRSRGGPGGAEGVPRRAADGPIRSVAGPGYGGPLMNAWDELERRVRERGVRVEQRLALIALLRDEAHTSERFAARRQALLLAVTRAAADVRREALA